VTRRRKTVNRPDALTSQFAKQLAETRTLTADKRDIARANLAKIEDIGG
jgi:hypothetical protein